MNRRTHVHQTTQQVRAYHVLAPPWRKQACIPPYLMSWGRQACRCVLSGTITTELSERGVSAIQSCYYITFEFVFVLNACSTHFPSGLSCITSIPPSFSESETLTMLVAKVGDDKQILERVPLACENSQQGVRFHHRSAGGRTPRILAPRNKRLLVYLKSSAACLNRRAISYLCPATPRSCPPAALPAITCTLLCTATALVDYIQPNPLVYM